MIRPSVLVIGAMLAVSGGAASEPPRLDFPAACVPGEDCWLVHHLDHDPGPGALDYACGGRVYDGHTGTDIGLRSEMAMRRGVAVVAAAPGTVTGLRDGVEDRVYKESDAAGLAGKSCGNGVLVDHGGDWTTQYCHLRRGSLRVRQGDRVAAGQPLGLIGMSGKANFPHVHFEVRHQGRPVDPFTGLKSGTACGLGAGHLWQPAALKKVVYSPVDIYALGFAATRPDPRSARAGHLDSKFLAKNSPQLAVWTDLFSVRKGDLLRLSLTGPNGWPAFEDKITLERDWVRYFHYIAGSLSEGDWPAGRYEAVVELERPGSKGLTRRAAATLTVE
jgi:Peptidase family M23